MVIIDTPQGPLNVKQRIALLELRGRGRKLGGAVGEAQATGLNQQEWDDVMPISCLEESPAARELFPSPVKSPGLKEKVLFDAAIKASQVCAYYVLTNYILNIY